MGSHRHTSCRHLGLLALALLAATVLAKKAHHFELGDEVPFYVNKVGPYINPTEAYEFYSLPFCAPREIQHKHHSLGEDLTGTHKVNSLYDIRFRIPIHWTSLCKVHLAADGVRKFIDAIEENYYFEMIYDDLPIRGWIGKVEGPEYEDGEEKKTYYLYKHLHFHILYNNDQIIYANCTPDPYKLQLLDENSDDQIEFSYSAEWEPTDWPFKDRNKLYEDFFSKELEIHWLSIMNSFVLVLLLTGFLAIIIMRILKSDYQRYAPHPDEEDDEQEDYGWKLVHGDVFRFPPHKNIFSALIGLGTQSLAIFFGLLSLALLGVFYPNNKGTVYTAAIVLYAITCVLGGYTASKWFKQMGGENWVWNVILVSTLFSVPVIIIFAFTNSMALAYHVTAAVPFGTIFLLVLILCTVGFPLNVIGGIAGRRSAGDFSAPCRTKNFTREIPPIPFYRSLPCQMVMAGFLPFSAIYIELFYLYSSVWGHSTYQLFGILFLVAIILLIVTACITVALTYFQLSMEDHRWWWHSFLNGGATGLFIYAYSIFYYVYRSKMNGALQASFYFGWMGVVCYFFMIMLGTVGWYSSLVFIRKIYSNLKID